VYFVKWNDDRYDYPEIDKKFVKIDTIHEYTPGSTTTLLSIKKPAAGVSSSGFLLI
jgi:hypothetical protein